jgi:hypothetical protein
MKIDITSKTSSKRRCRRNFEREPSAKATAEIVRQAVHRMEDQGRLHKWSMRPFVVSKRRNTGK